MLRSVTDRSCLERDRDLIEVLSWTRLRYSITVHYFMALTRVRGPVEAGLAAKKTDHRQDPCSSPSLFPVPSENPSVPNPSSLLA